MERWHSCVFQFNGLEILQLFVSVLTHKKLRTSFEIFWIFIVIISIMLTPKHALLYLLK